MLVAQVEDQRGGAIEEPEHADAHKELRRGGEVPLQEGVVALAAVTGLYVIRVSWQPAGRWREGRRSFQRTI